MNGIPNQVHGLIPTYAGNTLNRWKSRTLGWAHPHVCGEHWSDVGEFIPPRGSSPRMRGTRRRSQRCAQRAGLIPTYAGNTVGAVAVQPPLRAHPHVCGEHPRQSSHTAHHGGSSPRMRGTHPGILKVFWAVGLIPTYAGNTQSPITTGTNMRAHPHVCGEHVDKDPFHECALGSSPRMRGTPWREDGQVHIEGLIPTYAGNTGCSLFAPGADGAHPHVCGEHLWCRGTSPRPRGSSPRMRGTP